MSTLAGVLPELAQAELQLRARAAARGIGYAIADLGGVRSQRDTVNAMTYRDNDYAVYVAALKRKNPNAVPIPKLEWRPIAPFGSSYHNFGAAFDVRIVARPVTVRTDAAAVEILGAIAPTVGLRWGGMFPKRRRDPAHFELAIPLAEAAARWTALGRKPGELPPDLGPTQIHGPRTPTGATELVTLGGLLFLGIVGALLSRGLRTW
jgi:hypothetical protein